MDLFLPLSIIFVICGLFIGYVTLLKIKSDKMDSYV